MNKIILKIGGMSCSACSNGLEKYLNKQEGVEEATVNLVMATATIIYNDTLTLKDIETFIEDAGFESLGEEGLEKDKEKQDLKKYIGLGVLSLIIMYISMAHMANLPELPFLSMKKSPIGYTLSLFLLTIPYLVYGFDIIKSGIKNLVHLMPNMDTLVTLGVAASYLYSIYGMIMVFLNHPKYTHNLYFESIVFVIYFIKLGRFLNDRSKDKTKDSIKELVSITPNFAHLKTEDGYKDVTIDEVKKDDILVCLSGEKIAVDGEITKGKTTVDESFITGESLPVAKKENDKVIAGSINYDGTIEYKAERIGKESTISEIVRLVVEASSTKAPISKIADRICLYFVPTVIVISLVTLIVNLVTGNLALAITRAVTVLVVACPCSLGLATPLALVISIGTSARSGILIKDGESLEQVSKVDTIVFDKTGTLTKGILTIKEVNIHCDLKEKEILELLASIEKYSTHPLARGINAYAKEEAIKTNKEFEVEDLPGYGVKAKEKGTIYYACNSALLKKLDIINSYEKEEKEMAKDGNSVIYLVKNKKVLATIGLKDVIRKESPEVVENLKKQNIEVIMLSGDNETTANKIAEELGITNVHANTRPKEKNKFINKLIDEGHKVIMVGDGINDAPSLTAATVGVSLSGATDIATNAANVVLINNDLRKIDELIKISKKTINNIKMNLFWAFIYNILMISVATGIIKGIKLNPMMASVAMILSSLTVTLNALRLRRIK